jgi:HD domain
MHRAEFLNACCAVASGVLSGAAPKTVAGLEIPDTPLAREATETARASEPPEIFRHSLRAFFFAELIAKRKALSHDVEAVYVAAILHDTGLAPAHMSRSQRFEVDGANLARTILATHGVYGSRAELIWDAISLHDQGDIARWKASEVMLVNAGVAADFGAYLGELERGEVIAVLQAAPRSGFIPVFLNAVANVVKQKPEATGNSFVTDVGYRMIPGFHLVNFCDEVKEDPFAPYA